jgi:acetyl esterase/lipase
LLSPKVTRTNGIVYGTRGDRTLGLDIIRPEHPNGLGILMLVSGGWKSREPGKFPTWPLAPVLRRGYTVFDIYHVSQPQATVMEIAEDMHRAVRFVRHHAREYGVDPQRLGVTGGSAGGHLALLLATRGGPGPPDAADPSAVHDATGRSLYRPGHVQWDRRSDVCDAHQQRRRVLSGASGNPVKAAAVRDSRAAITRRTLR